LSAERYQGGSIIFSSRRLTAANAVEMLDQEIRNAQSGERASVI
jgi:hypothetical protein